MNNYLFVLCLLSLWLPAQAQDIAYIDNELYRNCAERYSVAERRCGSGTETAYVTIHDALKRVKPGTTYLLREGEFRAVLHLKVSGTREAPIVFQAFEDEEVVLRNTNSRDNDEEYGPIWLDHVEHNHVIGLTVRGSVGFVRALKANHNLIKNSTFDTSEAYPSASKRGGLYFAWSDHNRILNNRILNGTDSLSLVASNHNVVEGNTIDTAGHDIWNIKCGSFNVIRGNFFSNPRQKLGSVFDCEEQTTNWHGNGKYARKEAIVDASKHNLIEGNVFAKTSVYYSTSGGNGIQYAGQNGIIRRNIFYGTNVGLSMTQYEPEADYNYGNRVYNNTFHDNICAGIAIISAGEAGRIEDNRYVNNALWDNHGWKDDCENEDSAQIVFRGRPPMGGHHFRRNLMASPTGGHVIREEFGLGWPMADVEADMDVEETIRKDPQFTDEKAHDYRPLPGSPLIDAAAPLTAVAADSGAGNLLAVEDAAYFYDGFGIDGEQGDLIQIGTQQARVIGIDYANNVLILDRELSWQTGDGVHPAYNGAAPDIGAIER